MRLESVFIYMKIFLESYNVGDIWKIGFIEDRQVIGPEGVVKYLSYDNVMDVTREVPDEGIFSLPVYNEIITDRNDSKGKYEVIIEIRDKYSDQTTEIRKSYTLI